MQNTLFTNVSIDGAMRALQEVLGVVEDIDLPIPKDDYIRLVELFLMFDVFSFRGRSSRKLMD